MGQDVSVEEMENFTDFTNETEALCQESIRIITPFHYRAILVGHCVAGILAIPPNALFLMVIGTVVVFPPNLRLLLAHFSVILLLYAFGKCIKSIYLLTTPVCGFDISMRGCKVFDMVTSSLVLPCMFYTLMALCTERLYATFEYQKYDKGAAKTPWLSCLLIVFSWGTSICIHGTPAFASPSDRFVPVCESSFVTVKSPTLYMVYIGLELVAGFISVVVYLYHRYVSRNMAINRAWYDLSSRFQVDQNARVNAILIPSVLLHMFCHLPTFIMTVLVRGWIDVPMETKAWMSQALSLWRLIYAMAHPTLALTMNQQLRHHVHDSRLGQFYFRVRNRGTQAKVYCISASLIARDQPMEEIHHRYIRTQWERELEKVKHNHDRRQTVTRRQWTL